MSEEIKKTWYYCNPEKKTKCRKMSCCDHGGPCRRTSNPEYAKKDENGDPIVAKPFRIGG